ncbi:hypothetical protein LCGC14_2021040 [marine sediment metagenome]|uniref:Thioredoxin domain-containing protein n=1 Tax=marine sediment metagenome TaxID=412755 RepID=A0A0F9EXT4_9ZZZZ
MNKQKLTKLTLIPILFLVMCIMGGKWNLRDRIKPVLVKKYKHDYSIVYITAKWCPACRVMRRNLAHPDIVKTIKQNYNYFVVDVDKNPSYCKKMRISLLPTTVIIHHYVRNGKYGNFERKRYIGSLSVSQLKNFLKLPKSPISKKS